jgi:hypothetical protein
MAFYEIAVYVAVGVGFFALIVWVAMYARSKD